MSGKIVKSFKKFMIDGEEQKIGETIKKDKLCVQLNLCVDIFVRHIRTSIYNKQVHYTMRYSPFRDNFQHYLAFLPHQRPLISLETVGPETQLCISVSAHCPHSTFQSCIDSRAKQRPTLMLGK